MRLRLKDTAPGVAVTLRPDLPAAVTAARRVEFTARRQLPAARPGARADGREPPHRLRLCYLAPRTDVGGGARVLFEHANRLTARGHEVTVLSHFPRPDWFDLRAAFRTVPFGIELSALVPDCDVIVCGYWDQVLAARGLGVAPVVHFEQGDFHLFEDIDRSVFDVAARNLAAADATITVSGTVAEVLLERYGVPATVVHNAVDRSVFTPAGSAVPPVGRPYVLFVGWDGNAFKGMDEMRRVWSSLAGEGRALDLVWVTPRPPLQSLGRVVVSPDQATLGALFRGASAYVCCSRYESFSLPCLEAMASGTPVVATRNTGVLEYARDGVNALLADVGDVNTLAAQLRRVLDDPRLAAHLREAGLNTAAGYSWDVIMGRLEDAYRTAAASWTPPEPGGWTFDLTGVESFADFADRLRRHAAAATLMGADAVAVPVSFPAFEGHRAVRWQVVARRTGGRDDGVVMRAYQPARADAPPAGLPYAGALRAFAEGRIEAALAGFEEASGRGGGARAAAGRWIVLSLLELGRDVEAAETVAAMVREFPDHSDYQYLQAMVGLLTGRRVDADAYVAAIELLGPATHYDEWFDDPAGLLRRRLLAPAR
ncbi:glycosyltransferase family 4 protein [Dactylosporangium sp. CA-233914]|uniref:glycosyltransferase family 4 protein n=1 Tax=Dactylosporangium sp. CA-233914 TaxID=3239934 RepID=UPI003D90CE5E